jgi:hypothetical protein
MSPREKWWPAGPAAGSDVARALAYGLATGGLVVLGIVAGSRGLKDFDTALVPYAGASVFAAFGIGYRYTMWLRRPPTRVYWFRGWRLFLAPRRLPGNLVRLVRLAVENIAVQRFIGRRSRLRWAAHLSIFWGCVLAAAITFPLSFGWIRFETLPDDPSVYRAFLFGLPVFRFPLGSAVAPLVFNALDIAAVLVLAGIFLAMWRRGRDRGALTLQQLSADLIPLVMLFSISVTGILLTVSARLLEGFWFVFLSQFHAVTVIFTLLYLPFGKFFHIFQRPAQLSLEFYREAGRAGPQQACAGCGGEFTSALHVEDLKRVEAALSIRFQGRGPHYQEVCPSCRRKLLAVTQDTAWRDVGRPRPARM